MYHKCKVISESVRMASGSDLKRSADKNSPDKLYKKPSNKNAFQCEYSTTISQHLKQHKEFKHQAGRYPCDQCEFVAKKAQHLRNHVESIHEGIRYPCEQCEYKATASSSLKRHIESMHDGIRYSCDQCEYLSSSSAGLRRHKNSKHIGVRYLCGQCEFMAMHSQHLRRHVESEHEGIRYPCDQCIKTFKRKDKLKKHKEFQHYGKSQRYPCDQCDKTFKQKYNLNIHKQTEHEKIKYSCDQCEYVGSYHSLNYHKKSKHDTSRYPCDQCEYVGSYHSLNYHKKSKHDTNRHQCDQCEYVGSYYSLYNHKYSKHKGTKLKGLKRKKVTDEFIRKTKFKAKNVKVMIEKCDLSEYLGHQNLLKSTDSLLIETDAISTRESSPNRHPRMQMGDISNDISVKGKNVKVMIENLDLNRYLSHQNRLNSTEPEYMKISSIDKVDTEIKIEQSRYESSTHFYDGFSRTKTLNKYEINDSKAINDFEHGGYDLQSIIEIKEELDIKTESSDLSEYIAECNKEDTSNIVRTDEVKSEIKEPDAGISDPVTVEEFFPQWNLSNKDNFELK